MELTINLWEIIVIILVFYIIKTIAMGLHNRWIGHHYLTAANKLNKNLNKFNRAVNGHQSNIPDFEEDFEHPLKHKQERPEYSG